MRVQILHAASADEVGIQMGLQAVNDTLANDYIRPDESTKAQVKVKGRETYTFIDRVKVRLVESDYWAQAVNFGDRFLHFPTHYVPEYERPTTGGIWAQLEIRSSTTRRRGAGNRFGSTRPRPSRSQRSDLEEWDRQELCCKPLHGRVPLESRSRDWPPPRFDCEGRCARASRPAAP